MPRFSRHRVLSMESAIFRLTGKPVLLVIRSANSIAPYNPGNLFAADTEPLEAGTTTHQFIYAKFEETDTETFAEGGRSRSVKGLLTVPIMYKSLLAAADYIDPYLDGSRFRKVGAIIDETRAYCSQQIEAYSLASVAEVV